MENNLDAGTAVRHSAVSLLSALTIMAIHRYADVWPVMEGQRVDLHFRYVLPLLALAVCTNFLGWARCRRIKRENNKGKFLGPYFWTAVASLSVAALLITFEFNYLAHVWKMHGQMAAS